MNFLVYLLINLGTSLEWSVPAWILLIMHYARGWSIYLFWAALGVWIAITALKMLILRLANRLGSSPSPKQENKNPYSAKNSDFPFYGDKGK